MPIYEYVCQSCENRFEVKQGINDPPIAACQRCGQPVVKVISAPAIMFKGTGWYVTDYSDKMKPSGPSENAGNGKSEPVSTEPKTKEAPAGSAAPSSTPAPAATPAAPSSTTSGSASSSGSTPSSSSSGSGS